MAETLVAHASVWINASRAKVWDALTNPAVIKQYMSVTDVVSEWRVGSPIAWRREFQGQSFEMKGTVLWREPQRLLEYDRSRPIFRSSRAVRSPEGYHRVTIELSDEEAHTRISVAEQGSVNDREFEHPEGGWRVLLANMKALLEGTSV